MVRSFAQFLILNLLLLQQAFAFVPGFPNKRDDEITPTIVGGSPAAEGEFPYQVQFLYNDGRWCGGSIIAPSTILTAAHCFDNTDPSVYTVIAGHIYTSDPGQNSQTRSVSEVIVHERYWSAELGNDIAIIKLTEPFEFNDYVNKIPIPSQGSTTGTATGTNLVASGWGDTSEGQQQGSDELLKVILPVVSPTRCRLAYPGQVYSSQVCAGYTEGGKDTCQGDSGGPLATLDGSLQVGIVSWGRGCAQRNVPGIYTKVASFINWITPKMS